MLLVVSRGSTQALIPVFAIGVFVGFTLSQTGMVRHWHEQHGEGWARRAFINGLGAVLTTAALAIELVSKFTEGAWLVVLIIPLFVLLFTRIHRVYAEIGRCSSWARRRPRLSGPGRWPSSRSAACPGSPGKPFPRPCPWPTRSSR